MRCGRGLYRLSIGYETGEQTYIFKECGLSTTSLGISDSGFLATGAPMDRATGGTVGVRMGVVAVGVDADKRPDAFNFASNEVASMLGILVA